MCNCADMPDMHCADMPLCSQTCQPDRPDMHCAGQLWRKTFTFTFYFSWRQDKTLVPWTVRFSRVCRYRLGGLEETRRGRGVGDTRRFYFFGSLVLMVMVMGDDDGSAELPRLGCLCVCVCEERRERERERERAGLGCPNQPQVRYEWIAVVLRYVL